MVGDRSHKNRPSGRFLRCVLLTQILQLPTMFNINQCEFMIQRLPITQARINLGAVVKRVRLNKEYVILEKGGIPVAGLMDIDEFEDYLEIQNPRVREHIRKSREEHRAGKSRLAEKLSRELHAMAEKRA